MFGEDVVVAKRVELQKIDFVRCESIGKREAHIQTYYVHVIVAARLNDGDNYMIVVHMNVLSKERKKHKPFFFCIFHLLGFKNSV